MDSGYRGSTSSAGRSKKSGKVHSHKGSHSSRSSVMSPVDMRSPISVRSPVDMVSPQKFHHKKKIETKSSRRDHESNRRDHELSRRDYDQYRIPKKDAYSSKVHLSSHSSHSSHSSQSVHSNPGRGSFPSPVTHLLSPKFTPSAKQQVKKDYSSDSDSGPDPDPPTMLKGLFKKVSPPGGGKGKPKQRRIRDMLVNNAGGFIAPNANRKKKADDESGMFGPIPRPSARALEYKHLPFKQQPIQFILGQAVKCCREETVYDKFIMVHYTRGQEVRRAMDQVRATLGTLCNLSISAPFLTEHTKPTNHSKQVIREMSEACAGGTHRVWEHDSPQSHDKVPRMSDYRTMMIQGATPVDFLAALKVCLATAQEYPKQVCVRLCSVEGGLNCLPIYEAVVQGYADMMFDKNPAPPVSTAAVGVNSLRTSSQDSDDE